MVTEADLARQRHKRQQARKKLLEELTIEAEKEAWTEAYQAITKNEKDAMYEKCLAAIRIAKKRHTWVEVNYNGSKLQLYCLAEITVKRLRDEGKFESDLYKSFDEYDDTLCNPDPWPIRSRGVVYNAKSLDNDRIHGCCKGVQIKISW